MRIETAKTAGFCFGVRRAVEMVENLARSGEQVSTLGPLIHNPFVVSQLKELGVTVIEGPDQAPENAVVAIRSHGVGLETYAEIERLGLRCMDATCPYVAKIHAIAGGIAPGEGALLIAGDPEHPEVQGIVGHCKADCRVVRSGEELKQLAENSDFFTQNQVVMVAQTTFNTDEWQNCVEITKKVCTNLTVFDTICSATISRQNEAKELARRCDRMIVIGGANSSNTAKLYEICREICPTYLIEGAADLENISLQDVKLIGVTAGASTPACIIKEVQQTMSNLENHELSFEEMLNESFKSTYNGERVKAVVIGIKPNEVLVDVGTKHAAYVPLGELTDDPSAKPEDVVKVGDEIDLIVVRVNDVEGTMMLSKKRVDAAIGFEKVMNAAETEEILEGVVVEVVRGGLLASTSGVRVFIPASQSGLPRDADLNTLLKQPVRFRILETNRQRRRAVGSISSVLREERKVLAEKFWQEVEAGKTYQGIVKSITNFGVFVDLGGVDGRIGMTDLTWKRIKHPSEIVKVGDLLEVTVKDIDEENKKISLIYKKSEDNPWEIVKNTYEVGSIIKAKIMSVTSFGAFAQVVPGVDGLIHISQIAKERIEKVADKLAVGDEVDVKITELDLDKKRISLSIRALLTEKEEAAQEDDQAE